jgi:hypothetical protein
VPDGVKLDPRKSVIVKWLWERRLASDSHIGIIISAVSHQDGRLDADCADLCKHPVFDKAFEAVAKPPSATMIVNALYKATGEYHALRDEPASQLSIAVQVDALRLVNASLSHAENTTRLEIMLNIIAVGAGVMVSSALVYSCPDPNQLVISACSLSWSFPHARCPPWKCYAGYPLL